MQISQLIDKIPLVANVCHFTGTVLCHVAQGAGDVTKTSLHHVGDRVYDVLQGFKTLVDSLFGCGLPPTPPVTPTP